MKLRNYISRILFALIAVILAYFSMVGISYMHISKNTENMVEVKIEILGEKNEEAKGCEARVLEIRTKGHSADLQTLVEGSSFFYEGGMLVGYNGDLRMPLKEFEDLSILFLKHPWSGLVKVTIEELGIEKVLDLYSPSDATIGFSYQWDSKELWDSAYRLKGFHVLEFVLVLLILVLIMYLCVLTIKKFFQNISSKSLKIGHLLQMAAACFIICLLSLYPLFRLLRWGLVLAIFIVLAIYLYKNRMVLDNMPHYIYAGIYVVSAVLMLFLLPPGHVPDESYHYLKVYKESVIGDNHVENEKHIHLPRAIDSFISVFMRNNTTKNVKYELENYYDLYTERLNQEDVMGSTYYFGNTSGINNTSYLVGISIQMLLNFLHCPPILCIQLIRFAHLLLSYILCYIFIQKIPDYKRIMTLVMLLPLTVQQSFGIGQDWITNLTCFAIITYIFVLCNQKKFTRRNFLLLFFLSFLLGNVKIGYFAVLFLVFIIPHEKFANRRSEYLSKIVVLLPCMIYSLEAYVMSGKGVVSAENTVNYSISFILHYPFRTAFIYINTVLETGYNLFMGGLVTGFGWFTHYTKNLLMELESGILILMILASNEGCGAYENKSHRRLRVILGIVFAIISTFVFTSLFLGWTRVGLMTVAGLQARYFIVPLLCLSMMVQNPLIRINVKHRNFYYAMASLVTLTNGVVTIARGFYY